MGRLLSPSSSSDSISGSTVVPPCPMDTQVTEEDFSGDDIDKLGTGKLKRKKVGEDAIAQIQSVKELMQDSHQALEEIKA